jgi:hypothetical protein
MRKTVYAGEIDITEEMNALTLRKKLNDNTSVRIYKFLFEKMESPEN